MLSKQQLGAAGERRAERYLADLGYGFVAANYRTRYGEIDLIMRDGPTLVFVEVKTRRARHQGYPEEAVTALKLRHTVRVAAAYRTEHRHAGNWRVDVVSVSAAGMRHLENVTAAL